ncbi:MAG: lipase maturation factor family protein [Elusimicrobia bacterium]|nr:lipase maturation factor family protein [Elusimicrobiota bacterium]
MIALNRNFMSLLREDPFKREPPRHIRAVLYQYRFSSPAKRRESGSWVDSRTQGTLRPRFDPPAIALTRPLKC